MSVGPRAYVICVGDAIVGRDLAETVAEFDASARILMATDANDVLAFVAGESRIGVAFLALSPADVDQHNLGREIGLRGGAVVLLGRDAEERRDAWSGELLERPFTGETVIALLSRLASDRTEEGTLPPASR